MKKTLKIGFASFQLILLCLLESKGQNTRWFECKYFNQETDIQYLHNPYLKPEINTSKARLLISSDAFGITIYNSSGPSYFYKDKIIKYKLDNGKSIELHEGINEKRQYYLMGITAPIGFKRQLYDSSIIISTRTNANLYGTKLLYDANPKDQITDTKFSVSVDSSTVLNNSLESLNHASTKNIMIIDGKKFYIDQKQFEIQIIKGTSSTRHYVVLDDGTEVIVKEFGSKIIISKSFIDGGLLRFYTSRK